eukprot:6020412-Prymnesium_polylepis.1
MAITCMPSGVGSNLTLSSAVLSTRRSGVGLALRIVPGVGVPYEAAMTGTACVLDALDWTKDSGRAIAPALQGRATQTAKQ